MEESNDKGYGYKFSEKSTVPTTAGWKYCIHCLYHKQKKRKKTRFLLVQGFTG